MLIAEGKKGGSFYFNLNNGTMIIPITRKKHNDSDDPFDFDEKEGLLKSSKGGGLVGNTLLELYHDGEKDCDDDPDLLSSPVIELDHKVEEVRFAEI